MTKITLPKRFPRDIDISIDETSNIIILNINKPDANMQNNVAAFESWALVLRINNPSYKIKLSFIPVSINSDDMFHNLESFQQHYLRFLYRLEKFSKQMSSWFSVSEDSAIILSDFQEKFKTIKKINNVPDSHSTYNEKKGVEHILEKAFSTNEKFRTECKIGYELYDQLPNGIFINKKSKSNKIFNTGYFDLWGKDPIDNAFALFELKEPKNKSLGIISELFFYSNVAYDLLHEQDNFILNNSKTDKRSYKTFLNLRKSKVKSYFFVCKGKLHAEFKSKQEDILRLLNENSKILYALKEYELNNQSLAKIKEELKPMFPEKDKNK